MKKIIIFVISLTAVAGAVFAILSGRGEGVNVKTMAVQKGDVIPVIRATGTVVSRMETKISAREPGQIMSVLVKEGDRVEKNDVLAVLDKNEALAKVNAAKAGVGEAIENSNLKERNWKGLKTVYEAGGTSLDSVKDAKSALDIAKEAEKKAVADLDAAVTRLGKMEILAPFKGIVTKKDADPGQWAQPGTPLFTLSEPGNMEIEIRVDEADAGLVIIGQTVELSCDAYPGKIWKEKVIKIDPAVQKEGSANTVKVRTSIGIEAPKIRFGQQADAKIHTASGIGVLKLPFESIITKDGKPYAAKSIDDKVVFVPLETGIEDSTHVEIRSGLKEKDEVIIPEGKNFREGMKIKTSKASSSR